MTDDLDGLMDARLRAAGERWRDGVSDEPVAVIVPTGRHRRFALIGSAAAVVAVIAIAAGLLLGLPGGKDAPDRTPGSAVGAGPRTPPEQLIGRTWRLTELRGGNGVYRNGLPVTDGSLTLKGGELSVVSGGCSVVTTARATASANRIEIAKIRSFSARSCAIPTVPVLGGQLPDLLGEIIAGRSVQWRIVGSALTVVRDDVGTATFTSETTPKTARPLVGTTWELESAVDSTGRFIAGDNQHLRIDDGVLAAPHVGGAARARVGRATLQITGSSTDTSRSYVAGLAGMVLYLLRPETVSYAIESDALFLARDGVMLIYRAQ